MWQARRGQLSRSMLGLFAVPFCSLLLLAVGSATAKANETVYLVMMKDLPPTVAYRGSLKGYRATEAASNGRLTRRSSAVRKYADHLGNCQAAVMKRNQVLLKKRLYSYRYSLNGFAVSLTSAQAEKLKADPDIAIVEPQRTISPSSLSTVKFLELPGGLWRDVGGRGKAGKDVIVGVVDSGIWPEHPSFSDQDGSYGNISTVRPTWSGGCAATADFPECNGKLVGAKFFADGLEASGDIVDTSLDFLSARDSTGHGSHSASVAAGNYGVPISFANRTSLAFGPIGKLSGVAPRARISVYKVFWTSALTGENKAYSSDVIAAIDMAVADGVDIINYSAAPNYLSSFFDPVMLAALFATESGIFFSAAAGNQGPGPSTLVNFQPWVTTVAATSDDRFWRNGVLYGRNQWLPGTVISPGTNLSYPVILGQNASLPDAEAGTAEFCFPDSLDPALVAGRLVLCTNPFDGAAPFFAMLVEEVKAKGGVGVIVRNRDPAEVEQAYVATPSEFPLVQISFQDGQKLESYCVAKGVGNATAQILGAFPEAGNRAPAVMDYSSRGPLNSVSNPTLVASANDILKPDIAAPGNTLWGAYSPATGESFQIESGTSVSAAVISGFAALLKELHPDWSPYAMKSALLTTCQTTDNFGLPIGYGSSYTLSPGWALKGAQGPFDFGSGFVDGDKGDEPGLVYDSSFWDYVAFLYTISPTRAARGLVGIPNPGVNMTGRDLNLPNFGISNLVGSTTVQRSVTSVTSGDARLWRVLVTEPAGVTVTVSPPSFKLAAGDVATYNITFTVYNVTNSPNFVFGSLVWRSGRYRVRSQIAVQPIGL